MRNLISHNIDTVPHYWTFILSMEYFLLTFIQNIAFCMIVCWRFINRMFSSLCIKNIMTSQQRVCFLISSLPWNGSTPILLSCFYSSRSIRQKKTIIIFFVTFVYNIIQQTNFTKFNNGRTFNMILESWLNSLWESLVTTTLNFIMHDRSPAQTRLIVFNQSNHLGETSVPRAGITFLCV